MRADRQTKRHTDTLIGTLRPPTGDDGNSVQWVKSMELNDWWKYYRSREFLANVNSRSRSLYYVARPSVCRLTVCLFVTFVRPTQPVEIFGNFSSPFGLVPWPSLDIHEKIYEDRPRGTSPSGGEGG